MLNIGLGIAAGKLGNEYNKLDSVEIDSSDSWVAEISGDVATLFDKTSQEYKEYIKTVVQNDKQKRRVSGYVEKSVFNSLNIQTVNIPANFAGLEAVDVPTRLENQLFRITEVVENEDYVEVTARHVWYDNLKNFTLWEVDKNNKETDYSAAAVCKMVLDNAVSPVNSRVATDCSDTKKGSEFDYKNKNLVECFLDPDNGICAKFGLSLIRDNWDFYCLKEVGYDRGFVVENGKNLLGVERTESIENVATRVVPYAKDGSRNIVWMDYNGKKYVDSSHIDDYSCPMVELYDTGLKIGEGGVTQQNIQEKLLEAGRKRFTDDKVDIPEVEMTIEFISLGDTEEYVQYRDLDKVYLYDILTVKDTIRGYSYTAQVVGVEHDVLTGMLTSVTIGKLNNWDGTRKIATWQVPEVDGTNIRLLSIQAGSFAPGAIQADDIMGGVINAYHIQSHSITTDQLETGSLDAEIVRVADAEIETADIGYAQIKDLSAENLIAHDAITDTYYIKKLSVDNAQFVHATVGDLVVKASDGEYYQLDIQADGSVVPVRASLTAGEITAGVTSDGRASIIETDLDVSDLSASNMKAINALIDKLTADRIDVNKLFAREATISKINAISIVGNRLLALTVKNGSTLYTQGNDPALESGNTVKDGDRWKAISTIGNTWSALSSNTISQLAGYPLYALNNEFKLFVRVDGKWEYCTDDSEEAEEISQMVLTGNSIRLEVADKYGKVSGIDIVAAGIEVSGSKYVKIKSGGSFVVESGNFSIDTSGNVSLTGSVTASSGSIGTWNIGTNDLHSGSGSGYVKLNSNTADTYAIWAGSETAANAPFRVKRDGSVYLTSLWAVGEDTTETEVNLRTAGLWKLNYNTVKSYTSDSITLSNGATINFTSASSLQITPDGAGNVYILARGTAVTGSSKSVGVGYNTSGTKSYRNGYLTVPVKAVLAGSQQITTGSIVVGDGPGDGLAYDAGATAGRNGVTISDISVYGSPAASATAISVKATASNGASDIGSISITTQREDARKTGWNQASSSQYVIGTCYEITAHSGDWVQVRSLGTGYSQITPIYS